MNANNHLKGEVIVCSDCQGWGMVQDKEAVSVICPTCQGKGVWFNFRDVSYFWSGIEKEKIALSFISIIASFGWYIILLVFTIFVLINGVNFALGQKNGVLLFLLERGPEQLFFWLGVGILLYFIFLTKTRLQTQQYIDRYEPNFQIFFDPKAKKPSQPIDLKYVIAKSARDDLKKSIDLAEDLNQSFHPFHLLRVLTLKNNVKEILIRLEIKLEKISKAIDQQIEKLPSQKEHKRLINPLLRKVLIGAFLEAFNMQCPAIDSSHLMLALFTTPEIEKIFSDLEVTKGDLINVVLWSKIKFPRKFLPFRFLRRRRRVKIKHHIMNRAWTARTTPLLDRYSYDLTDLARAGAIGIAFNREREIGEIMRILERSTKNNVLLIGEVGAGRTTIVKALAKRIIRDEALPNLIDKRIVVLDAGAIAAGAKTTGALQERLISILNDIKKAGNVIVFIPEIHNLASSGAEQGVDASEILAPTFSQSDFQVIGSTTPYDYHAHIEPRASFANTFDIVKVEEVSKELAIKILILRSFEIEEHEGVKLTFGAIKKAVELSARYMADKLLPGKAYDLLTETAVLVRKYPKGAVVRDDDVIKVITEKTGIPLEKVTGGEAKRLLALEDEIHRRIINQEEAVKAISESIRRVRVGIKKEQKPIGVFLFLGPTGVGKTELAKALAESYFGQEKVMIRFDMTEFQGPDSIGRLIGTISNGSVIPGRLTEEVKRKPFSLILLDELEKAAPNVLDLFLQVFDDGRATDVLGRTIDFSNTIIIATSNAGSKIIKESLEQGKTIKDIEPIIEQELLRYYKPEFLNRFTAKIIFRTLSPDHIKEITKLQINRLAKRLEEAQGVTLKTTEEAIIKLANLGFSPAYGARFLERVIQEKVENLCAHKILKGELKRGDTFLIREEDIR